MSDTLKEKFGGVYCAKCKSYGCAHAQAETERRKTRMEETTVTKIEDTLTERGATHGDYLTQADFADTMRQLVYAAPNWQRMPPFARDAILMIIVKLSRILIGDYRTTDSWWDIAGYATLAHNILKKDKSK